MEIEKNIQWHPAFCSAMELELLPYKKYLRYEREHNLGKMPLKIDFLVVREEKPIKLLKQLGKKYSVVQKAKGIYRVSGLLFPVQFVVTKELDKAAHVWVSSLTRKIDLENARRLLGSYAGIKNDADRRNADSVVNVASEANIKLFKKMIQEGDRMCDELAELLAPEIVQFKVQLANQNVQLTKQHKQLANKDAEIAKLKKQNKQLADKDAEIARLKEMLADKDAILREVLRLRK